MKNLLFLLPLLLLACDPEPPEKPDTERPVIQLTEATPAYAKGIVCELPEDRVFTVYTGEKLTLHLAFSDDKDLSQYKIDVHNNFDCHTHRRQDLKGVPWFLVRIREIGGTSAQVVEELEVPADATVGNYHLLIYCTDLVGSEARPEVFSVQVRDRADNVPPVLTLTAPADGVTVKKGATLTLAGTVTENHSLANGRVEVSFHDPTDTFFTVAQEYFAEDAGREVSFEVPYEVSSFARTGLHRFHVEVFDAKNNATKKTVRVNIEP